MTGHENITQDLLDVAQELIVIIDKDFRAQMISRRGCEILKCAGEDITGKDFIARFSPERLRDRTRQGISTMMSGRIEQYEYNEDTLVATDGKERDFIFHNKLLYDNEGRVAGLLSSARDITDQRRMERAARQAREELETVQKELTEAHDALAAAMPV